MQFKGEVPTFGQQRQVKVLCIDNHASSNLAMYLLTQAGYEVSCAGSFSSAMELIDGPCFDLYLINDELAGTSGKQLLTQMREAMAGTPVLFYSTVIYPFSPRLADQSGNTAETSVPVTEVAIAVNRTIGHARPLARRGASICAAVIN
jgi:DNA-binding NarL/FixJ family response regulator